MEESETAPALPDDAIAAILCRLPARTVVACRCVCKAWRDIVDARGLLLPHGLHGIFLNFIGYRCPRFFARPSSELPGIHGKLGFLPNYSRSHGSILDHCNGLVLYDNGSCEFYVVNPATRWWNRLPPRMSLLDYTAYLVFDPAVSPHYEVFLIPRVPKELRPVVEPKYTPPSPVNLGGLFSLSDDEQDAGDETEEEEDRTEEEAVESPPPPRSIEEGFFPTRFAPASSDPEDPYRLMEWPPSPYTFHVFSSCTGCWEERSFVREGESVGTVGDVRLDLWPTYSGPRWHYGVYWRGALYVHCHGAFVMRLSLTDGTYQVIKTPTSSKESYHIRFHLGRSEKGVYFAIIENYSQLQIWIMDESNGQIDWVLKQHRIDLDPYVSLAIVPVHSDYHERINGPWFLEDEDNDKMMTNGDYEWNTDEGNTLDEDNILDENGHEDQHTHCIEFLGFHPYKEIIFLMASFLGIAYHLNTSKVQYLGKLRPDEYNYTMAAGLYESFPYTPCMIGGPPNHENHQDDQQYK